MVCLNEKIKCPGEDFKRLVIASHIDFFYDKLPYEEPKACGIKESIKNKNLGNPRLLEWNVGVAYSLEMKKYELRKEIFMMGGRRRAIERLAEHARECRRCFKVYLNLMDRYNFEERVEFDKEHLHILVEDD